MGAGEAGAEAAAARFSGTTVFVPPPPTSNARQDGVTGEARVIGRSRKKLKLQHLDRQVLVDPERVLPALAGAQGSASASAARTKKFSCGSKKTKSNPCVCGCGKDTKGSGYQPHKAGSDDRRRLFQSLGMQVSRADKFMASKTVRVHSDHFTPNEIKVVYKRGSSEIAYRQLKPGALRNEMPCGVLSSLLGKIEGGGGVSRIPQRAAISWSICRHCGTGWRRSSRTRHESNL